MKQYLFSLSIAAALLFATSAQTAAQKSSADVVMQKVANKLASVKALGYTYRRELNYPSEGYLSESVANGYLDLKPADGTLGFRYQFSDDNTLAVYNGSERFITNKKIKTIRVQNNPSLKSFDGFGFFYNSPLTLKYVLPKIIADKAIVKKLSTAKVLGRDHYLLEFSLRKATISTIGEITNLTADRTSVYRLTVDKKTFLPVELIVTNDKNKDFTKTTFSDLTENPATPSALSWYYSTYSSEYKPEKPVEHKLITPGQTPPDFKLSRFDSVSQTSLEQYKGKVVLLEFWIAHCGFCIAAVPKLNSVAETFRDRGLEVISINIHDPAATIGLFKKNNKPEFTILTEGESTSIAYGVGAYPGIVLIGKDGKVAYSSLGLQEKELETAITANLQK